MDLLKLTERAGRVLECCEKLQSEPTNDEYRLSLEAALTALATSRPVSPPIVVGLFNQAIALGDGVAFRIADALKSPTPEAFDAVRRAVLSLHVCVFDLHGASLRRGAGMNMHRAGARRESARPTERSQ